MKFEVEIPNWVNWIAQDRSGLWFGYSIKPSHTARDWNPKTGDMIDLANGSAPDDFTQELYEIIREVKK